MEPERRFPSGMCFGNYELTAFLGEGGMGTVYAAIHRNLGKRVAIKTLRAQFANDPDSRARFLREGKAAAAVRHPNVVDVDDVGIVGETPYLVMELLEGEALGTKLARVGRLSTSETADVLIPVLLALASAHRSGVVHRDLKPDNIFIARDDHGGTRPKLLDFGISKLTQAHSLSLTDRHALLGTPYYMAPEQVSSARDVDARSDLYSIGVILYHCVTGRLPFAGTTLTQLIGQILHAQPAPFRELGFDRHELPAPFEAIVLRCLAKAAADRPAGALELARELAPFASRRIRLMYEEALGVRGEPEIAPSTFERTLPSVDVVDAASRVEPVPQTPFACSVSSSRWRETLSRRWASSALLLLVTVALVAGLAYFVAVRRAIDANSPAEPDAREDSVSASTRATEQPEVAVPVAPVAPVARVVPNDSPPAAPPSPQTPESAASLPAEPLRVGPRKRSARTPTAPPKAAAPNAPAPAETDDAIWGDRR